MNITWGEYRTQLRRSVFKDVSEKQWTNDVLLDCLKWSLRTFAEHTAVATSTTITITDATQLEFDLPSNLFADLEETGRVIVFNLAGQEVNYIDPIYRTDGLSYDAQDGYYVGPENKLVLRSNPGTSHNLKVMYYAYYDEPASVSDDDFVLKVPQWSFPALNYLITAYSLTSVGSLSAMIRQFDDEGNQEKSAIERRHEMFMRLYEHEVSRYKRQDRIWGFRKLDQDTV